MPIGGAPGIGTSSRATTVGSLLTSVRAQIPDPVSAPGLDGSAFSFNILMTWLNDAMKIMCSRAGVINDWYALPSEQGMDVYVTPSEIQQVVQLWYDTWPCWRSPELDALFVTKITARSYFFGVHSIHYIPRLHVWPACDRTSTVTTTVGALTASSPVITVANASTFQQWGFVRVEDELILYRTLTQTGPGNQGTLTQTLRGQGGTIAAAHADGAPAIECNIVFRNTRLPVEVTGIDDIIEVPLGLQPLLELYILSQVREAEQDHDVAMKMSNEFDKAVDTLANKTMLKGITQGLQVRSVQPGPMLYNGRVYIP